MALREGGRWFGKSVLGFLAGMGLLAVWVDGVGIRPELAIGINHVLIAVWNYWLADQWVFQNHQSPTGAGGHIRQFAAFQGVMLAANASKYVLYLGLLWLGVWYLLAWALAAGALFVLSFAGSRRLWASV